MTEETAKALIGAIDRLISLLEQASVPGLGGIHIYHHSVAPAAYPYQPVIPSTAPWSRPVIWG